MTEYVYLDGSEKVGNAGHAISGAADQISQAANQFDMSCHQLHLHLYEFMGTMIDLVERLEKLHANAEGHPGPPADLEYDGFGCS